jgi:PAS domain S-box-containing protein
MDAAGDGHIAWIVGSDEFYASPRFLQMCGFADDTTFRNWHDFLARLPLHPEDSQRVIDAINATFVCSTDRLAIETRIVELRHGETRWLHLTALCTRAATGELLRWNAVITDITDRKRADEALRKTEEDYALALEASGEGHWDWNIATNEYHVSPRLLELCGLPRGTRFKNRDDFLAQLPFHPDDRPRWEEAIAAHFAGATPRIDIELRMLRGGDTQWIHLTAILSRDDSGKPVRWTGSLSDISERKRTEHALRESEKRYELAMLAAEAGFWDWDVPGDEFYVSPKLLEMSGIPVETRFASRADFMARVPFYPEDRAKWMRAVQELFASGGTHLAMELRFIRDGETRWTLLSGMCVRDAAGKIVRWTGSSTDVTARKRAEEALRESEQRYERAMLATEAGFWDWDVATDKYYVSPKLLEKIGFPIRTEFAGRADFSTHGPWHPDDLANWERAVKELFVSGGTRLTGEMRTIHGAETRWYLLSGMCLRDSAGKVQRWTGSAIDITKEKRAQEALRLSEERYALAMEASDEGHFDWNVQTDEIFASERLQQIFGLPVDRDHHTRGELMAAQIPFHPDDRARVQSVTRDALEGPALHLEFEYRLLRRQLGKIRWIHTRWKIFRDAHGTAQRIIGVVSDITERKRAEEKLRSHQEMVKLAQMAAGAVAFEWRAHAGAGGNRWSPDLEAMYGLSPGAYDGTEEALKKLIHPEDWPNVRTAIEASLKSGDLDAEYRAIHPDGAIRWLQAKGRTLFDPEGKPSRVVGFMFDVTDRHVAEEDLQRIERQLRQAQRLEALGTLAGGIAHDFNNLLGVILGYGEMALRNVRTGSPLRHDIENIIIAGERGNALVERILAFSRSGIGERVAVHVERVVRETLVLFAAKLPPHIVVEHRLRAGRAAVMGDPTQIHQVLMNLLANAKQAMPSGGKLRVSLDRITVRTPRVVTNGSITARDYVVIDVSDSGSGIPPEIFERIFDPFFTTKKIGVGTGLGLSLVHGIVTGLGGAIEVATTVGKGSAFKVYLPRAGDATVANKPGKRVKPQTRRAGRGRVLIIDDEQALVRLAIKTLTESGYSPVGFTASTKALQAFVENPKHFDAVVTDESMPGMSGSELIRKMRELRPTLPILLVSGYVSAAVIERAKQAGATAVLKKPLAARQLQVAVDHVLSTASGARKSDAAPSKVATASRAKRKARTSRSPR